MDRREDAVPVTVLCGQLGAGKTTLVNNILVKDHGYKIAVVLNEVGDSSGIESAKLREDGGEGIADFMEMQNGCICCQMKSSFLQTLEELLRRHSGFNYILVETTGIADPAPIAEALWADEELEAGVILDAIVTLVDGVYFREQLEESLEAERQVALADIVIINKADLVSKVSLDEAEERAMSINSGARYMRSAKGNLDPGTLLKQSAMLGGNKGAIEDSSGFHEEGSYAQGHGISTVALESQHPLDEVKVVNFIESVLWDGRCEGMERSCTVLRGKGIINVGGSPKIFQAVRELYELQEGPASMEHREHTNRLILIGTGLDRQALQRAFEECR